MTTHRARRTVWVSLLGVAITLLTQWAVVHASSANRATAGSPSVATVGQLYGWTNSRGGLLATSIDGQQLVLRDLLGAATTMTAVAGAAPGAAIKLVPAQGAVLVGVTRTESTFGPLLPFRVDVATGLTAVLPAPADAPGGLQLRGTDGNSLVWDTGTNQTPRGGIGLRIQKIGGAENRPLPVPGFRSTLDVTTSQALVAIADGLGMVGLANGVLTRVGPVATGTVVTRGALLAGRVVYVDATVDGTAPTKQRVHSCWLTTARCTTLLTTTGDVSSLVATSTGFAMIVATGPSTASLKWGTWLGSTGQLTGSQPTSAVSVLARAAGQVVVGSSTSSSLALLDLSTGLLNPLPTS